MSKNKPGKHSEVASSNELLVAETQQRIVAVQEVGVEDDLDSVLRVVEQVAPLEGQEHWVLLVVNNVVGRDRRPEKYSNISIQQTKSIKCVPYQDDL